MSAIRVALIVCCLQLAFLSDRQAVGETPVTGVVLDSKTKVPIPARIYLQAVPAKIWHFVEPAVTEGKVVVYDKKRSEQSVERHTSVSADPFRVELPRGEYQITIEQGKEYIPLKRKIVVDEKPLSLTFSLERWSRVADDGWYSGDTHVHRTMEDLPVAMLAEDLNVALPLNYWVTRSHTPPSSGDTNPAGQFGAGLMEVDSTHVIYPMNTEYEIFTVKGQRHTLGAVFVLNHQKPFDIGVPPVTPIMREARKQGALLDLDKHSWPWSLMLVPTMNVDLFELSNNHLWRTDFFFKSWTKEVHPDDWEVESDDQGWTERGWMDFGFKCYYALLNCGFDMKPSAGTASGVHPVPLGFGRVYVHVEEPFTYGKWIEGLAAGRSFVTTGPMLDVTFNGKRPGSRFRFEGDRPFSLEAKGSCTYYEPVSRLEIIINGEVVKTLKPQPHQLDNGAYRYKFDYEHPISDSSWMAVRGFSETGGRVRFVHSAPVHVDVPSRPLRPKRKEIRYFVRRMEEEITRNRSVLDTESLAEYEEALKTFRQLEKTAR